MKGQIVVINQQKQTGAIAAEDGQHVLFALGEWTGNTPPERGMPVEFELNADGQARAVQLAASGTPPPAPVRPPPAPPVPPAPAASSAPPVPPPAPPSAPAPAAAAAAAQPAMLRHSGLGIAAFIISLGIGLFSLVMLLIAGAAYSEGEEEAAEIIGAVFIVLTLLQLLPLVLGILGLRQTGRKKLFALLGTVISSLALLFSLIAVVAGVLVEESDTGYAEADAPMVAPPPPQSSRPAKASSSADMTVINTTIANIAANEGNMEEYRDARMVVSGDLNGDGRNDAAVIFTLEPTDGGNWHAQILAVFLRQSNGALNFIGGDHVETVQGIAIRNGRIQLQTLSYADEDPRCCPSIEGTVLYAVRNGKLSQVSN